MIGCPHECGSNIEPEEFPVFETNHPKGQKRAYEASLNTVMNNHRSRIDSLTSLYDMSKLHAIVLEYLVHNLLKNPDITHG